ncbi:MAG: choice-of-anchor Q domain-containing protein, partial [Bacteroidota bacterium]|nr:choice-of-anchor Q domain-containing protein [Bacteroidota bacterium]
GSFEHAEFKNSIIYGSHSMELLIESYNDLQLNYLFDYCLTRIDPDSLDYLEDPLITNIINNEDPLLDSIPVVYELDSLSPAIDAGLPAHAVEIPFDLNGNSRLDDDAPDLGAYERIED